MKKRSKGLCYPWFGIRINFDCFHWDNDILTVHRPASNNISQFIDIGRGLGEHVPICGFKKATKSLTCIFVIPVLNADALHFAPFKCSAIHRKKMNTVMVGGS